MEGKEGEALNGGGAVNLANGDGFGVEVREGFECFLEHGVKVTEGVGAVAYENKRVAGVTIGGFGPVDTFFGGAGGKGDRFCGHGK